MDFEGEGIVEGYQDLIRQPEKKHRIVMCPNCMEQKLEEVRPGVWICECGFSTEEDEE